MRPSTRPTVVPLDPPGNARRRAVDGERLLDGVVSFARALRAAGLTVDTNATIDFSRALTLVRIEDRDEVREAGASVFVRRREDRATYEAVFARFWRPGSRSVGGPTAAPATLIDDRDPVEAPPAERAPGEAAVSEGGSTGPAGERREQEGPGPDEFEVLVVSPQAWSHDRLDRHRQFDRMTGAELREAERFVDLLSPRLELRRTRRRELHPRGRVLAPRPMFRRNLKTGGDPVEWVWQRTVRRPRTLVVLCDISGSMERHSRLLLRFAQALAASAVRTEAFVFGTRLTRVTRLLDDRDRDRALARVAEATTDWSGGTRIGDCLREFNRRWARRVLRSSAVVVVISDGWDRGDPAVVGLEMARLRRSCHRLIWLNPLASAPGYQPLAGGMAAALPSVDEFVAAGTLASLEHLAALLSGHHGRRPARRTTGPSWDTAGEAIA